MSDRRADLRVVLVAEEAAGVQALRALEAAGATVVAVLTSPPTAGRGATVADLARKLGYPVWPGEQVRSAALARRLREHRVDLLLNVHSLHRIHREVVEAPALGSFNLHPGPLPAFAGLNAPSWAVYLGERRHAVTVHRMAAGIDTGPVCYEAWFDLDDLATGLSVSMRCVRLGMPLLERLLREAGAGVPLPARDQDPRLRRQYRRREVPHGGRVPWDAAAEELARWIRASDFHPLPSPWGYPATHLGEQRLQLARGVADPAHSGAEPGTVVAAGPHGAGIATGRGTLNVRTLVKDGRRVGAGDLLRRGMKLC